jgi:predicted lipoprotein with Yx(FWY)xxD motif
MRGSFKATAIAALIVAGAAACGSSSSGGTQQVAPQGNGGGTVAVVSTHASPVGTYLTDSKGRTLYLWKADTGSSSTCAGECAKVWAPYTTSGTPKASSGAKQSMLGTTDRSDGSTQVTYADHPLYYYDDDESAGDMNGQGSDEFGNEWWVVAPSGSAITSKDSGGETSSPSESGGGWG